MRLKENLADQTCPFTFIAALNLNWVFQISQFLQAVGVGWRSSAGETGFVLSAGIHPLWYCAHGYNQALGGSAGFTGKSSILSEKEIGG